MNVSSNAARHPYAVRTSLRRHLAAASSLLSLALLVGCSADFSHSASSPAPLASLTGNVHGGQQPVTAAQVYLYAAGTAGYGTPARSMLAAPGYTTTDTTGAFSITGNYTCQPGDQVYLLATGGNPGLAPGSTNPALTLMAALGPCSALTPSTFININEVTTVAAAYALAGFMDTPTTLSSSGTPLAKVGVANAFLNASNLANPTTGTPNIYTAGGNGGVPAAEISTLANILAACVNSTGVTAACTTLFTAATPASTSAPTDTAQAIINLAHNPGLNVSTLYALATPTAPFQPTLPAAPHDWSIAITYFILGLPGQVSPYPAELQIDGLGNVWELTLPYAGNYTGSLVVFDPTGALISPAGFPVGYTAGLTGTSSMAAFALDPSNNAWVAAYQSSGHSLVKINGSGAVLSPPGGYIGGGLVNMTLNGVAIDAAGHVWVAGDQCCGPNVAAEFSSTTGAPISPATGYLSPNTGVFPTSLFATPAGGIWAGDIKYSAAGTLLINTFPNAAFGSLNEQTNLDAAGNIWSGGSSSLYKSDTFGNVISPPGGFPAGVVNPNGLVTDGLDRIWYANSAASGNVGVMDDSGNVLAPNGYQLPDGPFQGTTYNDIDPSGNLWLATNNAVLVEFVGIAAPVVRPLATAVATNSFGLRP